MFVTKQELNTALGTFKDKIQQKFYQGMYGMFNPLQAPKPGDWLHGSKQAHQAFSNYKLPFYNQVNNQRNIIYIQQFDEFNQDFIKYLCKFCALFYPTLSVKCLPVLNFKQQLGNIKNRQGYYWPQYLAQDVLAYMQKRVPKDAYCVMGITLQDIYPGDSWLFVYGWAKKYKARVGIFSFLRFDEEYRRKKKEKIDWNQILYPSMRTMAHQIGHMFGVTHCVYYRCLMNGFNGIEQNYTKPFEFCPICYRKISINIGFNFVQRYQKLADYCSKSQIERLKNDQPLYEKLLGISKLNPFKIIRQIPKQSTQTNLKIISKQPIKQPQKKIEKPVSLPFKQPIKKQFIKIQIKQPLKAPINFSIAKSRNNQLHQALKKPETLGVKNMRGTSLYTKIKK